DELAQRLGPLRAVEAARAEGHVEDPQRRVGLGDHLVDGFQGFGDSGDAPIAGLGLLFRVFGTFAHRHSSFATCTNPRAYHAWAVSQNARGASSGPASRCRFDSRTRNVDAAP